MSRILSQERSLEPEKRFLQLALNDRNPVWILSTFSFLSRKVKVLPLTMSVEVHKEKFVTSVKSNKYEITWVLNDFSAWWDKRHRRYKNRSRFPSGVDETKPMPSSMSKDMDTLVDGTTFGDVTILIDGQRFLAYKGILSARSAVFAAMFKHPMQESTENCIAISDVEPGAFKELLRYIYTDQLTCLETMAQKLYQAADKYDIQTLKSLCRCHILKKMSSETAADTLVLADMHGDKEMKSHALGFLSGSEAGKVTKSAGWKKMFRTHPYLVDETFEALTARKTVG
ncbi:hypothetical protein pipiens_002251 [Culex pipiens pipiens]|uniref:BTB domain-containing protein n=1 Tax=Culex pipiens pipiens TaxID=38569 RepID=A0ABD1DHX9_CULPP